MAKKETNAQDPITKTYLFVGGGRDGVEIKLNYSLPDELVIPHEGKAEIYRKEGDEFHFSGIRRPT